MGFWDFLKTNGKCEDCKTTFVTIKGIERCPDCDTFCNSCGELTTEESTKCEGCGEIFDDEDIINDEENVDEEEPAELDENGNIKKSVE